MEVKKKAHEIKRKNSEHSKKKKRRREKRTFNDLFLRLRDISGEQEKKTPSNSLFAFDRRVDIFFSFFFIYLTCSHGFVAIMQCDASAHSNQIINGRCGYKANKKKKIIKIVKEEKEKCAAILCSCISLRSLSIVYTSMKRPFSHAVLLAMCA